MIKYLAMGNITSCTKMCSVQSLCQMNEPCCFLMAGKGYLRLPEVKHTTHVPLEVLCDKDNYKQDRCMQTTLKKLLTFIAKSSIALNFSPDFSSHLFFPFSHFQRSGNTLDRG